MESTKATCLKGNRCLRGSLSREWQGTGEAGAVPATAAERMAVDEAG